MHFSHREVLREERVLLGKAAHSTQARYGDE
jgi:hypothetical protein